MLSCSKNAKPCLSSKFERNMQKFKLTETRKSNGKKNLGNHDSLSIKEGSIVLLDDSKIQNMNQNADISNFVRRLPQDKSYRIITDPRHFLMQSWWKQKTATRKNVTAVPFNIQACVVPKSVTQSPNELSTRLRSRSNISEGFDSSLKLQCPICARTFAADWTVRTHI
jgi:hypothetical protein